MFLHFFILNYPARCVYLRSDGVKCRDRIKLMRALLSNRIEILNFAVVSYNILNKEKKIII